MQFNRADIKGNARAALKSKYWPIVGMTLLSAIIVTAISACSAIPYVGFFVSILVLPVITVGVYWFNYRLYLGEDPDLGNVFAGFKDGSFLRVLGGYWLMLLFTFLWSLLLIIPGVIKSIAYSLTPYILLDHPELSASEAIKKSQEMTNGYKWDIFVFYLSFIGWALVAGITFGIAGVFYVFPYMSIAEAGIYDALKRINGDVVEAVPVEDVEQ